MWVAGGVEFNHNLAADYISEAAGSNYVAALGFKGLLAENGDGAMFLKSDEVAVDFYQKAADVGHCGSIKRLINVYTDGGLGKTADAAKVSALNAKLANCVNR